MSSRGWLATLLLVISFTEAAAGENEYAAKLEALAAKCDQLDLPKQAAITRAWHIERHAGRQYLFLADDEQLAASKGNESEPVRKWRENILAIRRERAAALFEEAKQAVADGKAANAFQLLHEVLREDPEHAEARRILGHRKNARDSLTQPRVDHPKLGWKARSYWRQETPHFSVTTNHSAGAADELGQRLEALHALWRQVFFDYWSTAEGLKARFDGGNEPLARPRPKHQVVLLASREEYLAKLRPHESQINLTSGIYLDRQRTTYLYAGDPNVVTTWWHEATHQLFQEGIAEAIDRPGQSRNFWAIEGAAMYMESLAQHDGYWTVGGCEADRLQFARYRALAGDFAPPLARTTSLGREQVQKDPDIRKWYAHFAGLTHFLMDGQQGRHREAVVRLLAAIYRGNDRNDSLADLANTSAEELDTQYLAYLRLTDADLANIPSPRRLRNLSLGNTEITDAGLVHLADYWKLEWLDLSRTAVSDTGFKHVADLKPLQQLFLEGTRITDASLPIIAGFADLEELDLSRLPVTDDGLTALAPLSKLKILHLGGTRVSDAGIAHLAKLKNLESLDVTGTRVTAEGLQQLRAALPNLKTEL